MKKPSYAVAREERIGPQTAASIHHHYPHGQPSNGSEIRKLDAVEPGCEDVKL